jgi:hypothetical protein
VLRREFPKPEALKPRRAEVVNHDDITWRWCGPLLYLPCAPTRNVVSCSMWALRLHEIVKGQRTHNGVDHNTSRSTARRHCGDPSCMGVNSPRRSHNPNHSFTRGLRVSVRKIAGGKEGYSKSSLHDPTI